jgi:hypothetical protein
VFDLDQARAMMRLLLLWLMLMMLLLMVLLMKLMVRPLQLLLLLLLRVNLRVRRRGGGREIVRLELLRILHLGAVGLESMVRRHGAGIHIDTHTHTCIRAHATASANAIHH